MAPKMDMCPTKNYIKKKVLAKEQLVICLEFALVGTRSVVHHNLLSFPILNLQLVKLDERSRNTVLLTSTQVAI